MKPFNGLTTGQLVFEFLVSVISLAAAMIVFGVTFDGLITVFLAVLLIAFLQLVFQPLLDLTVRLLGVIGVIVVSLTSSSLIIWAGLELMPGITLQQPWDGLWIGWIYALFITIAHWAVVSQSDDVFLSEIVRKSKTHSSQKTLSDEKGFLFVQLDGVPAPVLDWQLKAGNLPNIRQLIDDEGYTFTTWKTQVPSTTPASQAGILFGSNKDIPAFRWYEKKLGRLVVANQLEGAELIEKRCSNGNGLLVNDGVSIGNLFSGDAETNIMVMSKLTGERESIKRIGDYTNYLSSPFGLMRSIILSFGEMLKEIFQARRQVARDIQPRIKRHGSFILLRAATNVLLRNLQTAIVVENMLKGKRAIYVDYLDYDEVAHHAGIARAESLASLSGLDRVLGILYRAKEYAARPYEMIILSDHGQSQGPPFRQLHNGKTLEVFVEELTENTVQVRASTEPVENQSPSQSLLSEASNTKGLGKASSYGFDSLREKQKEETSKVGKKRDSIVITGSGNLGNIWLNQIKGRATQKEITTLYPKLIQGLLDTYGVGLVLMATGASSYVALSRDGLIDLKTGQTSGTNPLGSYPDVRCEDLLRVVSMKTAPDIAVISSYDPTKGEVYAFEELVGNHGGIGGWQREAILLHPKTLIVPQKSMKGGYIQGAEKLHQVLKSWLNST